MNKRIPENSTQHKTAGPYSPVLEIECSKLVVISGQASIDPDGNIVGDTIKMQAEYTLNNCFAQLKAAGCTIENVFKVNVYMTDLDMWGEFNNVYKSMMPSPMPVRTAVGTKLLPGLLVEIEMWAAK